jgi:hypothetical protein
MVSLNAAFCYDAAGRKKDGSEIESQPNGGRRGNLVVGEEHKLLGRGIEAQTRKSAVVVIGGIQQLAVEAQLLLYKPGIKWEAQQPPPPKFWMHFSISREERTNENVLPLSEEPCRVNRADKVPDGYPDRGVPGRARNR